MAIPASSLSPASLSLNLSAGLDSSSRLLDETGPEDAAEARAEGAGGLVDGLDGGKAAAFAVMAGAVGGLLLLF